MPLANSDEIYVFNGVIQQNTQYVLAAACLGQTFPNASFVLTSNSYIGENYLVNLGPNNITYFAVLYSEFFCNLVSKSPASSCVTLAILQINSTTLYATCELLISEYDIPANTSFNFYVTYSLLDITNENILLNGPNATFFTPTAFYSFYNFIFCSGSSLIVKGQFIETYTYALRYGINDNLVYSTEWYFPISNGTQVNTSVPYNASAPKFPVGTLFSIQVVLEKDLAGNINPVIDGGVKLPVFYTIDVSCYYVKPWPWWAWLIIGIGGVIIGTVLVVFISFFWSMRSSRPSERVTLISRT